MQTQYEFVHKIEELVGLLQDKKSQKLFWDRLKFDVFPSLDNFVQLGTDAFDLTPEEQEEYYGIATAAKRIQASGGKLLLYGTGKTGQQIAKMFEMARIPFAGFCGRRAAELKELMGKPVYLPEVLFADKANNYVTISASPGGSYEEIIDLLKINEFPQEHILPSLCKTNEKIIDRAGKQYFDFFDMFPRGKAFVDGGSYDGIDSVAFAAHCNGDYSKIFAFEPDTNNAKRCQEVAKQHHLHDFELIPAGLSIQTGTASFMLNHNAGSCFCDDGEKREIRVEGRNIVEVPTAALDDIVQDTEVGFIKMDIEGSELVALRGAQATIKRDKPLLAICVYHRKGDVLAIMDYLHTLLPEYRFWLRHYSSFWAETVLYAAVL